MTNKTKQTKLFYFTYRKWFSMLGRKNFAHEAIGENVYPQKLVVHNVTWSC
jgi:hypothetical protein